MDSTSLIPAEAYKYIYDIFLGIICWNTYTKLAPYTYQGVISKPYQDDTSVTWLFIVVALFVGFRPVSYEFSDMPGYAFGYEYLNVYAHRDIGLWWVAMVCKDLGFSTSMWFTVVCFIYYGAFFMSSRLLSKNNSIYIFLTILVAFSTLTYATGAVRNGLGISILVLGMSMFLTQKGSKKLLAWGLIIYAIFTHKSSILPLICFLVAYYCKVSLKTTMYFWVFSVVVSLAVGSQVSNIFVGLGFDDRMDGYLLADNHTGFSHSGFRFDFLLYSIMPIWLGYYALIKKGVNDRIYEVLLSTYILANAFWVMVIRAPFSDRFAYLSWFLYPIVIAYPLLKIDIWGDKQGEKARTILLLHFAFTFFMDVVYYTVIKSVLK